MANDLDSPDVRVRLQALDRWGQQAPTGAVDPLILALEDEDEGVQARALALIEQDWVRAQAAETEAGP
jgi:HEAT repeat protein